MKTKRHARISERVAICAELGAVAQVYIFIAAHLGDNQVFPYIETIAEGTGRDRRTVQRALKQLEARLLAVKPRFDRRGRSLSNLYEIPRDANGAADLPPIDSTDYGPAGSRSRDGVNAVGRAAVPLMGDNPTAHRRHSAPPITESLTSDSTHSRSLRSRESRARVHEAPGFDQPELLMPITGVKSNEGRSPIPENWSPCVEDRQYARKQGYSDRWIDEQTEPFRDTYLSYGEARADWSAVWRKWVRSGGDFASSRRRGASRHTASRSGSVTAAASAVLDRIQMAGRGRG
jgi:Helix-turn-helix domain